MIVRPIRRRPCAAFAAALILAGAHPAAAQCPDLFLPRAVYGAGPYALSVAVADINHDGIDDLIVANYEGGSLSLLTGRGSGGVGNGTFDLQVQIPVGNGPRNVVAGDFNRDGNTDVAVPLLTGGTVVLLGKDASSADRFEPPSLQPTGVGSRSIAAGDFNGDGVTDLVVTVSDLNQVVVLIGLGNGSFGGLAHYATGVFPWGVVADDFDGDGIQDLAVACTSGKVVSVLIGNGSGGVGNGTFKAAVNYGTVGGPINVVSGDFTGDGVVDLACSFTSTSKVGVLEGLTTGGLPNGMFFQRWTYSVGAQPEGLVAADFTNDGIVDLATANIAEASVTVLKGFGFAEPAAGPFAPLPSVDAVPWAAGIAVGDFDDDGASDLVVTGAYQDNLAVLIGNCSATPIPPEPHITGVRDVPNDQGGRVFLTWEPSGFDQSLVHVVTGYRVWRRIPLGVPGAGEGATLMARPVPGPGGTPETIYWEAVATLPAEQLEGYGYVAATLADSTRQSNPYTAFFITAITEDPFVFYQSEVDSGYSVDNIPPFKPEQAAAVYDAGGVALHWIPDPSPDVESHRIYRGTTGDFPLDDAHLIAAPTDTGYVDPDGAANDFYAISGMDEHGNEGEATRIAPPGVASAPGATAPALGIRALLPNPATGPPEVSFTLPSSAPAVLELVDIAGRRRCALAVGALGPGLHRATLGAGVALAPGLYVVRLTQSGTGITAKLVVTR